MQSELSRSCDPHRSEWLATDPIDMKDWLRQLWAGRRWLIIGGLVAGVIAAVFAFTMTRVYRATALLAPASMERSNMSSALGSAFGQLGGLASLAGINVNTADTETQEALAVLRSRRFGEDFIKDHKLVSLLLSERLLGFMDEQQTPGSAYKYFDRKVRSVAEDKKTGLISVHIDWRDRMQAATWANEFVARLNEQMRQRAIAKAAASLGYLQKELAGTEDIGTREAINRLIESQVKQRMLANVTEEYAFRIVDPALPPEPSDVLRPQKLLMIVLGALFGGLLASIAVLLFRRRA